MPRAMIPFIDLKSQYRLMKSDIDAAIQAVLDHGRYIIGPEVAAMEQALAGRIGARHCIAVGSGTDALLISLMALGIGPGDEVVTTAFTFAATAEMIILAGATPVLVDIEPDSCNIDVARIEEAITDRTRAIMPVSLYGQAADMDEINAIAALHGLAVIEDGAQSFGARYGDKWSCAVSTLGCTSFFPSKPLGCYGDGGAVFTDDDELAEACRQIRVHGQAGRYHHIRIGIGGRMDTVQCAVVLAKLRYFDREMARRTEIGNRYNALLDERDIRRVQQRSGRSSAFAQYTIFSDDRDRIRAALESAGVPTAIHYPAPLSEQPAFRGRCRHGALPAAETAAREVLSLPMHPYLDEDTQDRIVDALEKASRSG